MPKGKFDRRCKKCNQPGHFAKTCGTPMMPVGVEPLPNYSGPLKPGQEGFIAQEINKPLESLPSIVKNYTDAIDKNKFPSLHAATERGEKLKQKDRDGWQRVLELRSKGKNKSADALAYKLLGVEPKEKMDEETKEYLDEYHDEHKEEIAERRRQRKEEAKKFQEALERQSKRIRIRRRK